MSCRRRSGGKRRVNDTGSNGSPERLGGASTKTATPVEALSMEKGFREGRTGALEAISTRERWKKNK